jgi:hypothetical protein
LPKQIFPAQKTQKHPDYGTLFFVLFAIGLGGYIRISQALRAGFPINDGGLFYAMTRDLQASGFHLSLFTSYNNLDIPFVYPPLAFYVSGFLSTLTGWPLIRIVQILPSIIASLAIPAFYVLAKDLNKSKGTTALATLFFALIPSGFYWLVMGGGITRSFGFLFSIMTLWSTQRMYTTQKKKYIFFTAVLGAFACLSHPESALHIIASAILFFFFFGRNKRSLIYSGVTVMLVLILTSPWWITILNRFGFAPIVAAARTGGHKIETLLAFVLANITQEVFLPFFGCIAIVGIFYEIFKKRYLLPAWFFVLILSEPRSAPLYLTPLIALLTAHVMVDVIFASLQPIKDSTGASGSSSRWGDKLFSGTIAKLCFGFFLVYFIVSAIVGSHQENQLLVTPEGDREAFQWIHENLPQSQKFVVITGKDWLQDPVSEWFPALTLQTSIATVQGHEWLADNSFNSIREKSTSLQQCAMQDISCLNDWKKEYGSSFDFVYFQKREIQDPDGEKTIGWPLEKSLTESGFYQSVYETGHATILQVK